MPCRTIFAMYVWELDVFLHFVCRWLLYTPCIVFFFDMSCRFCSQSQFAMLAQRIFWKVWRESFVLHLRNRNFLIFFSFLCRLTKIYFISTNQLQETFLFYFSIKKLKITFKMKHWKIFGFVKQQTHQFCCFFYNILSKRIVHCVKSYCNAIIFSNNIANNKM